MWLLAVFLMAFTAGMPVESLNDTPVYNPVDSYHPLSSLADITIQSACGGREGNLVRRAA